MIDQNNIIDIKEFVTNKFKEKEYAVFLYHNLTHTQQVVTTVKWLGDELKLAEEEVNLLIAAAWFHDLGYVNNSENHEAESAAIAEKYLTDKGTDRGSIEKIKELIASTHLSKKPSNILEEVICDADLIHMGSENFLRKSNLLKIEFEQRNNKVIDDAKWDEESFEFLQSNQFHTMPAIEKFGAQREQNIIELNKRIKKHKKKSAQKKHESHEKAKEDKKATRGVETMFRNVMRTHVSFSAMADNKANIMISVNTLILTAVVAILSRKLDSNPHLIIPTIIITVVCLVTLIFATLVTRPQINRGTFSKDDIKEKKANLLFFGNFYNVDLKDFNWGMNAMMRDGDYLYDSMIKDFYFLGQVLGKKYKYLRICYTIFMYGLIISVIAFGIATFFAPEGTALGDFIE